MTCTTVAVQATPPPTPTMTISYLGANSTVPGQIDIVWNQDINGTVKVMVDNVFIKTVSGSANIMNTASVTGVAAGTHQVCVIPT